ncbi:MAG: type II toxin-antitoxin system RelE/ParE family toxin [Verrucomicrobiota bacterium]
MIVPSKTFEKHFARLDRQIQQRIVSKVEEVDQQLPTWRHERLQGRAEYKLRVGDWRVLYDFDLATSRLLLLTVRHRREVYR